jgi:multiple sugar transport system permease protein
MVTTLFTGRGDAEPSPRLRARAGGGHVTRQERRWGYGFTSPWLIGLMLFYTGPIIASLLLSFTSYELTDQDGEPGRFVGLENWSRLFSDPEVTHGAWITLRFSLIAIPLAMTVPLAVAYLLTSPHLRFKGFFRAMFYLPSMVPFIAAVIIWRFYLNGESGWFAKLFEPFGIEVPNLLNDPAWAMSTLWLIGLWGIGNSIIINIAALNGVSRELYEAALIDGAGRWWQFRAVTFPMISPIVFYNLVLALVSIGHYFVVPFALSEGTGNPGASLKFYTLYFYQQTFRFFQGGYGAALAWAMFLIVFGLTLLLFWSARFWVHYEYQERS